MGLCLGLSLSGGCFGSFRLVNTVYDFNRDVSDNLIVQEAVFLAFVIVQVYSVAAVVDAVILNVIEALTGDNPLAMAESRVGQLPDGRTVAVIEDEGGLLVAVEGQKARRLLRRGEELALVQDGQEVARMRRQGQGVQITDAQGQVHHVSAAELRQAFGQLALAAP